MYPVIEIFGRQIGSYAVCSFLGLLVCGFVAWLLGKKYKIEIEPIIFVILVAGVSLVVGGSILYGITNIKDIITIFGKISEVGVWKALKAIASLFGGSVFYGGFIASIIIVRLYLKKFHADIKENFFDLYIVCVPLFHAFGRLGCFFGGCCYGKEGSWGFVITGNTLIPEINDVMRIPVPLIEAFGNLCIFVLLTVLFNKGKCIGNLLYCYLFIYPPMRFVLEFYRGDEIRGIWYGLSTSQWISIFLFVFAVISVIVKLKRKKA